MQFRETPLPGAFVVQIEPHADARGFFARTWCTREFAAHGLPASLVQVSISHNTRRGTVRGMHLQLPPSRESKLVRCTRGALFDVIIDMRPESRTYLRHFGIELTSASHEALYIPPMMAHGFQTLAAETEVLYMMSDFQAPELGYGVRWNDPRFAIEWPVTEPAMGQPITILPRDASYPDFDPLEYQQRLASARAAGGPAAEGGA